MPNFNKSKGYTMKMDKPKINSNSNFNNKAETLMAASSMYMIGKNTGKGNTKITMEEFEKRQGELRNKNYDARESFKGSILSDSLTSVLQTGKTNELENLRFDTARKNIKNIKNLYGASDESLKQYESHEDQFTTKSGAYSEDELTKKK
jgi:hypothetical protein